MRLIGFADDICQNDEPSHAVAAYSGPKGLLEAQKKGASVFDGVSKSLIYSPEGDLSCAPGWLRGSPAHRDKEGKPTGRVDCFKAVGTFFGDPEACKKELTAHLRKKLAPLDVIDTIVDTDCVTNTSQLRLNLVQRIACAKTKYIAGITPPNVACEALEFAHNRIRKSFESIARADASPQALRDLAWLQAQLPTEMGGCNIDTAFTRADSDFSMSLLKNWRTLVAHNPDFALDEGGASKYPAIAAAIATYESALSDWKEVCEKRTARDKNKYYTVRGGYLTEFYPKSVPLPEPESLPATDAILNGTCKSTYPRPRALAAIKNHKDWYAHQELVKARDVHVKNNPSLGDSAVNNREAARFVSASTPFAGKALDVRVDGTYATALSSDALQDELQRKLGLWLSAALPTLRVALERGMPVDFFGDYLYNKAHHRRPHDGVLAAWADAMRAPANAPVVHGDKEKPELTRQYNEGYKVDLAEPHAGPGGCDEVNEVKLWTPLLKTSSTGVGNASSGGTPASVGHSYAFGNTEEKARRLNMGCKARGQPSQPFSHKTGHGYVKAHRGFYHDAIFVKRNNFNLLLHETFGGGFSPTAVLKLRRLARKVARGSVDRTAYSPKYSLSFMSHHAERISLSVVRGVNRAIRSHLATLSARLARA